MNVVISQPRDKPRGVINTNTGQQTITMCIPSAWIRKGFIGLATFYIKSFALDLMVTSCGELIAALKLEDSIFSF